MSDLIVFLVPVLLSDVANPVLFAFLVYLAAGERGVLTSTAALLGHTLAYFGSGIVIALAFTELTEFMNNPGAVSYGIGFGLGAMLLWVAWRIRQAPPEATETDEPPPSPGGALVTGAIINFVGIPFGLPYFVAIDQILKAELEVLPTLGVLAGYNLAYMAPFLIVPLLTLIMGENARAILMKISGWVEEVGGVLLPLILAGLGVFLMADAVAYFATGTGLY